MNNVADIIDTYFSWLKDRTAIRQVRDWTEVTTPFLDRHNDCIVIYAKRSSDGFMLTDDGHTLDDLRMSGCNLQSEKRQAILRTTLNGFGVNIDNEALMVRATADNFPLRKHNLIQAILTVNDLFYLASPTVHGIFLEDVAAWLDALDVRYIPRVKLPGASGFDHVFDFAIPRSREQPERLLRTLANPNRDNAQNVVFAWHDTRGVRQPGTTAIAILNDTEHPIPATVTEALRAYEVMPLPWSLRDSQRERLLH